MIEDFFNALHNFKINKMRTVLSLLGIIIGVISVVIVTTLGSSLYSSIAKEFLQFSMDIINVESMWNSNANKPFVEFNDDFRNTLLASIPKIKNVFYSSQFQSNAMHKNIITGKISTFGIEPGRLETLKYDMDYGNFFSATDYVNGTQKAILGDAIAYQLFPEGNAVGKKFTLQVSSKGEPYNFQFEVIGVLKKKDTWMMNPSKSIFVPRKFYKNQLSTAGEYDVWMAEVCVYNAQDTVVVEREIRKVASSLSNGAPNAVWTFSAQEQFEQMTTVMTMLRLILSAIAGISLLVGGIGIMNIMLVTVTERRKEIGIRKALGATRKAIVIQFLVESATLTLTGGTIGVAMGVLLSKLAFSLRLFREGFILTFSVYGTIIAFGVSVLIGVFFGLHPAMQAAKLDPVIALAD